MSVKKQTERHPYLNGDIIPESRAKISTLETVMELGREMGIEVKI